MGFEKSLATCLVTHKFQLKVEQLTYKNRNLRARAARASPKIVIYKPALRAIILHSRGRLHTVKIFGHYATPHVARLVTPPSYFI